MNGRFQVPSCGAGVIAGLLKTCAAIACLLLLVCRVNADTHFIFDPNGNLATQFPGSDAPPSIIGQPQQQIVGTGEAASFSVVLADTRAVTYQWRFDGANVSNATNDALLLTNVTLANQGSYSVVLANSSGSVTSAPAALMIDSDGDGLADSWELTYFGNLTNNAIADFDGDGISNRDEFLDGSNPTNNLSALFRLSISADGLVNVSPFKLKYTNGEVVTVTAVPSGNEKFHGWTGDALGTNTTLMLTMTTNRFLTAYFHYYTIYWTNTVSNADWHTPQNWSPNLVPAKGDTVVLDISGGPVANSSAECGTLLLGGPSIPASVGGSGTLTVHSNGVWASGSMMGPGRTIIGSNAVFTINTSAGVNINGRTFDNAGTILRLGTGTVTMWANSVLTNRPGALIDVQSASMFSTYIGPARVDNAGTIRKSVSTGVAYFFGDFNGLCPLNNYSSGTVDIQTGTLVLEGGGFNNGTITVPAGTTLQLGRTDFPTSAGSSLTGAGNFVCTGGGGTFSGYMKLAGSHTFTGGTINFNGNFICTNNAVAISTGTVNINSSGTVSPASLTLNSGVLGGTGLVTVLNQMTWTGGTLGGGGRLVVAPTATLTVNHPGATQVSLSRILENAGTIDWLASSTAFMSTSVITNRSGALFHVQSTPTFVSSGFTANRIDNAGTFRKSVSTGQLAMENLVAFNNYGTVDVQSGSWRLAGGGSSRGDFSLPAGTALTHAGNTFDWNGTAGINGSGDFSLTGGTVNFNGNFFSTNNTVTISGSANANFVGTGTLANVSFSAASIGGVGVLNVLTQMTWTAGSMSTSSGRTIIGTNATLTINHATSMTLGRVLDNAGTVLWISPANLFMSTGVITNRPGALFEARNNAWLVRSVSSVNRFDNAGTFRKLIGIGQTVFDNGVAFNNYGEADLQTGHLIAVGGGLNNSNMTVALGAAVEFRSTFTASAASRLTGQGQLIVSGAATFNGIVDLTGSHTFNGGTANLNGNYNSISNTINISTGTANFNSAGTVTPAIVNLSSGTLGGSSNVTVLNQMTWTSGAMNGGGRTIIAPSATLTLNNPNNVSLGARTVDNAGTILWTAAGGAFMANAVITNRPGALFHIQNATALTYQTGVNRFDNAGTVRKSGNSGTTTFPGGVPFNNYGALEIETGVFAASGGYTCTSNSLLHCVFPSLSTYGRLQASGAVALNGALRVSLTNGFVPASNDTFTVMSAGSRSGTFSSFLYPSNQVTMILSNTPTAVILHTTAVIPSPQPVFLAPALESPNVRLIWTATSNSTYRVEFLEELGSTNWTSLPGDVTTLSNTATKLDALSPSNRFYRVRVLP